MRLPNTLGAWIGFDDKRELLERKDFEVLQELLWVKTKFVDRIGFLRTRTQRSGTQCNGNRTRWLFLLPMPMVDRSGSL